MFGADALLVDMFGGYADVAAYYYDADLLPGAPQDKKVQLPDEYHPVWHMPDPWHSKSQCKEDFILIAEFSEIEGPKPLITIPKSVGGGFDLNEFAVRIMSVDSQSQPGESFKIHNDTSVVMSDGSNSVYSYVHNLTLYDSKARGFVRPFCIAYVTADKGKLEHFHEDIRKHISQVSEILKQGNLTVFVKDMTYHLSDLQYTQERYLERKQCEGFTMPSVENCTSPEDIILNSLTEESLLIALKEVKHILCTVNDLLSQTELNSSLEKSGQLSATTDEELASSFGDIHGDKLNSRFAQLRNSSSIALSSSLEQYSCTINQDIPIDSRKRSESFSGDLSGQFSSQLDTFEDHYQPKLVRTTNKRHYDKTLRTMHELCLSKAKQGLNNLRYIHKYYAKDLATLKLEKREGEVLNPYKGLLTFGRNVQLNFIHEDSHTSAMRTSKSAHSDLFSDETASYTSADSFLSCEDLSISAQPPVVLRSSVQDLNLDSHSSLNSSTTTFDATSLVTISFDGSQYTESSEVHALNPLSSTPGSLTNCFTTSVDSSGVDAGRSNVGESNEILLSLGSSNQSDTHGKPERVFCLADRLQNFDKNTPGYGLLKFMQTHAFSQHVLFTLLCGRPLIVVAKTGKEVLTQNLLNTLSFFLANQQTSQKDVVSAHSRGVTAKDMDKKLHGLIRTSKVPKEKLIPKDIEDMCSVFDLDRKVYYGPCYLGGVLTEVYSRRKVHAADTSYLAYVHGILQDLAMKAYVFYHTFIQNVAAKLPHMYSKPEEAKVAYRKAEQHFLTRMKVSAHDTEIIKYLAEVMHKQIDGRIGDLSEISTSSVDKIPCQVFKD